MNINNDELNLKGAFTEIPRSCHTALMETARSVQETTRNRMSPRRFVLVAAVVMLMTVVGVAAATKDLGWKDYLGRYGITVPETSETIMNASGGESWQVGPCLYTLRQQIADSHIAMSNFIISTVDGEKAIIMAGGSVNDPVSDLAFSEKMTEELGVSSELSWGEAALMLNVPLYRVRGSVIADSYSKGLSIEDAMWEAENRIVYLNMLELDADQDPSTIPVDYFFTVEELDPVTGRVINSWTDRDHHAEISVQPMTAERTYSIVEKTLCPGLILTDVKAEQYVTGVYVNITVSKDSSIEEEIVKELLGMTITDAEGKPYSRGMNLTIPFESDSPEWEKASVFHLEFMLNIDYIPESMNFEFRDLVIELR